MKIAPIIDAIRANPEAAHRLSFRLVHTGQHYDRNMSGSFFEELGVPEPDINLGAGGGTQAEQAAAIMMGYEKVLQERRSDLCLVVGDVTSTMACAIVARKMGVDEANLLTTEPMGYLEFNYLVKHAKAVLTDSGGITEETTVMGVPCMTLRDNTERPETITVGTSELIGRIQRRLVRLWRSCFPASGRRVASPRNGMARRPSGLWKHYCP